MIRSGEDLAVSINVSYKFDCGDVRSPQSFGMKVLRDRSSNGEGFPTPQEKEEVVVS